MPARAVKDSDDEYDDEPAGSRGRRSRKSTSKGAPSGLAAIDITKPLDEGDVLPEIKPYVVSARGGGVFRDNREIDMRVFHSIF